MAPRVGSAGGGAEDDGADALGRPVSGAGGDGQHASGMEVDERARAHGPNEGGGAAGETGLDADGDRLRAEATAALADYEEVLACGTLGAAPGLPGAQQANVAVQQPMEARPEADAIQPPQPAARASNFLARIRAQHAAGQVRTVVVRLPEWLRAESEVQELTRLELAASLTRAGGISRQEITQVSVITRMAARLSYAGVDRDRGLTARGKVAVDFLGVRYDTPEAAQQVVEANRRATAESSNVLEFRSHTSNASVVRLQLKVRPAGQESELLGTHGADAGLAFIDSGKEVARLIFTRPSPEGEAPWDMTDSENLAEFGGLVQRQHSRWFARHGLPDAGSVSLLSTRTRWVANSDGRAQAAMGVIVDLLVSEVPQHVPRSMPLDDNDDAWAQFK